MVRCKILHAALLASLLSFVDGRTEEPDSRPAPDAFSAFAIITRAPGLSTSEVEVAVTGPLERRLVQARGARRIESRSIAGLSVIRVTFRGDIRSNVAWGTLDALLRTASHELPVEILPPCLLPFEFASSTPLGYVVVTDDTIADAAESARRRLLLRLNDVSGMGPLAVLGDKPRQVLIGLDRAKLIARGMNAQDVAHAIKLHLPPSRSSVLRIGDVAYTVSLAYPMVGELAAIPLGGEGRAPSKLADVARVVETAAAPACSMRVDGVERVLVPIHAASEIDARRMCDAVRRIVGELNDATAEPKFEFLPLAGGVEGSDNGLIDVELRLPSGTLIEATETERAEIEGIVRDVLSGDVAFIISEVGVGDDWPAAFSLNAAESDATVRIQLSHKRKASTGEAAARLTGAFEEGQKSGRLRGQVFVRTSESDTVEAYVVGRSSEARAKLERFLAVLNTSFPQARILERLDSPGFQVQVDLRRVADLGVSP
ncbi:MAG TPA: efflux RND transporter permease subunit, partial [Pirellulales bacterium]|nr:efflux RND transporter permease subunit [Pirellulales bacterium]